MDNWDQLAIRACKSNLIGTKLLNRFRRIWARRTNISVKRVKIDQWVFQWLVEIREQFHGDPIPWVNIIRNADPAEGWKYGCDDDKYWQRLVLIMASNISQTKGVDIPHYHPPAWFRNRYPVMFS